MKVNIGPYPDNHWNTSSINYFWYQWRYKKFDFEVESEGRLDGWDRSFEKFCSMWQVVLNHTINPIIRHRRRKIEVRIDPHDTWGMDHTLGLIILPMLKQLRSTKHGSPWVDDEDVPHLAQKKKKGKKSSPDVRLLDMDEEDQHTDVHARWDWVLGEMIWSFEQVTDLDEGRAHYYVPYGDDEEVDRSFFTNSETGEKEYLLTEREARVMGRYDPDLHKAHQARVNRGLLFFGKYYQALWD